MGVLVQSLRYVLEILKDIKLSNISFIEPNDSTKFFCQSLMDLTMRKFLIDLNLWNYLHRVTRSLSNTGSIRDHYHVWIHSTCLERFLCNVDLAHQACELGVSLNTDFVKCKFDSPTLWAHQLLLLLQIKIECPTLTWHNDLRLQLIIMLPLIN